jgi:hypothetical protein
MITFQVGVLGCRFPFPVHHSRAQGFGAKDLLGDGSDGERLARAGPGHNAESLPTAGQLPDLSAVLSFEQRVDVQAQRQLDRLARRARGRNDDDAPGRRLRRYESGVIGREGAIVDVAEHGRTLSARTAKNRDRRTAQGSKRRRLPSGANAKRRRSQEAQKPRGATAKRRNFRSYRRQAVAPSGNCDLRHLRC